MQNIKILGSSNACIKKECDSLGKFQLPQYYIDFISSEMYYRAR